MAFTSQLGVQLVKVGLIVLLGYPLSHAVPVKRSVNDYDPCHMGASGGGVPPAWQVIKEDLMVGTDGLVQEAKDIKDYTSTLIDDAAMIAALNEDRYTFIAEGALGHVESDEVEAMFDAKAVLMRHLGHIYNTTTLLNYARNAGIIGSASEMDNSNESILRNKLDNLETRMDSTACNIYIGMQSKGVSEPAVPEYSIIEGFANFSSKYQHELWRVYILMKDITMVMGHMNGVYSNMD